MGHSIRHSIAATYGLKTTSTFGKYLGVDIRPNKLKITNFMGLLDKTMDRIRGWQSKLNQISFKYLSIILYANFYFASFCDC